MKARVALLFAAAVLAVGGGALAALRTAWAGERLCAIALGRARSATGLAVTAESCRVDPFRLEVAARGVRAGASGAPVFSADLVRVRLGAVGTLGGHVVLREVEVTRPRVAATLPAAGGRDGPCPPPFLDRVEVQRLTVDDGAVDLRFAGGERVVVGRFDVRSVPERRGMLAALSSPGPRRTGIELAIAGARAEWGGRGVAIDAAHLAADLALDLSRLEVHEASAHAAGLSLAATGRIERLCRPRFDLHATAQGEAGALLALLGGSGTDAAGAVAADVVLTGTTASPRLEGEVRLAGVRIGAFRPGDARARVRLRGRELRVDALEVPGQGGRVSAHGVLRFGAQVALEAEAQLDRVELGEIFARLGLPGAWVMARLDGRLRVNGTAWPLRLDGDAAIEFANFRVLGHGWESYRPGEAAFVDVPRGRIEGTVRVVPDGVRVLAARARAGAAPPLALSANLHFDAARGFEVLGEGGVDLGFLRHLGLVPVAGIASIEGLVVRAAPYGNPHVEARARVAGLHFLDLDLGDAAARLVYDAFVLRVEGAQGRRGATRYEAAAQVDLAKDPVRVDAARYSADGRLRDLFEAAMPWQPKAREARDVLDGDVRLRGTAHGPSPALDVTFDGELGAGVLAGRGFDGGSFAGRVERGARAVFDRAELRRGAGMARGAGSVGFDAPFPWSLEVTAAGVRLADLGLPAEAWSGALGGSATVRGSWDDPVVRFAGRCDGVAVHDVNVGAVELGAVLEHGAIAATARAEGVSVKATARANGDMPFEARADLDLEDLARYVPGGATAGLHARIRGAGTAKGTLADLAGARAELRLDEVRGGYGDFRVDATPPVVISVAGGRVALRSFKLAGTNTQFVLEGVRERTGELGLTAKGALDMRLLAGLLPGVEEPRGQLAVEARVGGTFAEPILLGRGALRDGSFHVKNAPISFAGVAGELVFSQSRMIFDGVEALVNGARAELHGEVELSRLRPVRVRVGAHVEELPVRIPAWLPAVMTGDLAAAGTWDDMLLSGRLHVVRARYTDPVDLEKSVVELRRKKAVTRPFDPADAWLRFDLALVVDGDARVENDLVRGGVTGALTLTGSLASPGLLGTLTLTDGSRGTFRGNELALTHAVVDFTDRHRIRMRLDANGDTRVRDYGVFMHLFGYYPELTLQLTSQPALSQEDIVTLLSLGFTTRDAAAGGVSGAATAAAAQAIFSASGLDDQVKRFVPRGKLLRDFAVRITTAYSEGAGQVEPRAELESKVLDDRLRLRYQAPLAGGRGQRAQAEMQLGAHTSVQYQWDNDTPEVAAGGDHGVDLKLRWEWND